MNNFIKRRLNMASKVFFITSDGIGRGDDELGEILMLNFLRLLGDSEDKPDAIVFMNAGTRLVCEDSELIPHIKELEEQGVEILACITCLKHFNLVSKLEVGTPTSMVKSIELMMNSEVVSL
jgi:selenium metabolism protein YedF